MLKKIFNGAILSIFLISILFLGSIRTNALVKGWTPLQEPSSSNADIGDNPPGTVPMPSDEDHEIESADLKVSANLEEAPDLGDDQIFPFAAGLDSY